MMFLLVFFSGESYTVSDPIGILCIRVIVFFLNFFLNEGRLKCLRFSAVLFGLVSRAEVADGIKNILFLIPDEAIIIPAPLLNGKTAGKWHTHWMTRLIEYKHGKCCYKVIEEAVHGVAEVRVALI
jgi:hypothetical protein